MDSHFRSQVVFHLTGRRPAGGDAVAMRCRLASLYLTLVSFDGSPTSDRLDCARRALLHADAAIREEESRLSGRAHRFTSSS